MKTAETWACCMPRKVYENKTECVQYLQTIQDDAYNQALTDAANKVKAPSHGLDCSCDGCVARKNDVATILELRIAEPSNARADLPPRRKE